MQLYKLAHEKWDFQKDWLILLLLKSTIFNRAFTPGLKDEDLTTLESGTKHRTAGQELRHGAVSTGKWPVPALASSARGSGAPSSSARAGHPQTWPQGPRWAPPLAPAANGGTRTPRSGFNCTNRMKSSELPQVRVCSLPEPLLEGSAWWGRN